MCMPGMSAMELAPDDELPGVVAGGQRRDRGGDGDRDREDAEEDAAVLAGVSPHER